MLGLFICVCIALCTSVANNTAQNRPDNFPSYSPDNHHCSVVIRRIHTFQKHTIIRVSLWLPVNKWQSAIKTTATNTKLTVNVCYELTAGTRLTGVIMPATPTGCRMVTKRLFAAGEGIVSPYTRRASSENHSINDAP